MGKLVGNYRVNQKLTAPGTDTITFTGYEVPRGKIAIMTYMDVTDYTTNAKKFILGIRDASGNDQYAQTEQGTAQNQHFGCTIEGQLILLPGERPIGIVESPTASDVCYFTVHGGLYSMEEGGAA